MYVVATVGSSTGSSSIVGPSNVLYVDGVVGSDATGTRGNAARPYSTIQAALDAMLTDDVVQLAPQTFSLSAPLTIPTTVIRGTCQGWGSGGSTNLSSPPGMTTISAAAGVLKAGGQHVLIID